jgi:hypothetical protein
LLPNVPTLISSPDGTKKQIRKIKGHKKKRRQCDAERMRKSEKKREKEERKRNVRKSLKSFPELWCVLILSRAPRRPDKKIGWRVESQEGVSVSHAMFLCFSRFLFLFSMHMIQRFLFFDLSTGAGARK